MLGSISAAGPSRYQPHSPSSTGLSSPGFLPSPIDPNGMTGLGIDGYGYNATNGNESQRTSGSGSSAQSGVNYGNSNEGTGAVVGSGGGGGGAEGSRRNPLVDLIDSEKAYVDQLSLVIRKVAAAWSRKDFPPPKLDAMFRCVEAVFRANRSFGTKLKEIGPSPSSPKALGDLLMRWIDDLEPAYTKYCSTYMTGFDNYPPVQKNTILPNIISEISSSNPPSPPLEQWSLDALFLLPYSRLRYYRKLYARLLRSTKEGRSDHKLLVGANQRLDNLVEVIEGRLEIDVGDEESDSGKLDTREDIREKDSPAQPPKSPLEKTGVNGRSMGSDKGSLGGDRSRESSWADQERNSRVSSGVGSSRGSQNNFSPFSSRVEDRSSAGSAATSITQSPSRRPNVTTSVASVGGAKSPIGAGATAPLSDLELRIDTDKAIDLFTMTPKKCKLQMNPSTLPYTRGLRSSHDLTITFTPTSTKRPVTHKRAHIFILTDLFLIAEWMEASEKAAKAQAVAKEQPERVGQGGPMPEMWLSYPPLAGKHLMVAEGQQSNILTIMVMKKETFVLHAESEIARDQIMKDLLDCIEFASNMSRRNTAAATTPIDARSPSSLSEPRSQESSTPFPPLRYPSPFSATSSPAQSPRPSDAEHVPPVPISGNMLSGQINKLNLQPGETFQWPRGPTPPPTSGQAQPGAPLPQRGASLGNGPPPNVPGPGPPRDASMPSGPPRGASLRQRQQSLNLPVSSPPSSFSGAPQLPSLPFGQHSDPNLPGGATLPRSPSGRSISSNPQMRDVPPIPTIRAPGSHLSDPAGPSFPPNHFSQGPTRSQSAEPLRPLMIDTMAPPRRINPDGLAPIQSPSARFSSFAPDSLESSRENSPPGSPIEEESSDPTTLSGPAIISAQMKCKVFLQQAHSQWKSLGSGKLKLYKQKTGNIKQLVVESESGKQMLISTIVLTDGVERVAKTGVAVEISDRGSRTGIIYMIQLRNESSALGLFESLLAGSDRAVGGR